MVRDNCLFCNNTNLISIVNLGIQPLADTFISDSTLTDTTYPLECMMCSSCKSIQTSYIVDPEERYNNTEYSYTSSNSKASRNYWDNYAKEAIKIYNLKPRDFILEIGSNDGYLLNQFKSAGMKVLGVDPSDYMAEVAWLNYEVENIAKLFNYDIAESLKIVYGIPKLIIANNVFNHSNDPVNFIKGVKHLMNKDSIFVCEAPYWLKSIISGRFDQIYHEHVWYFTARTMLELAVGNNLTITNIQEKDYHGGSLRTTFNIDGKTTSLLEEQIDIEEELGIYEEKTYIKFMKYIVNQRDKFMDKVSAIKRAGHTILAVGAAAKGNTLLNFYSLNNSIIDFVTDSSPHKQGKLTPATRIPICDDNVFLNYKDPYAIILSWNISEGLKEILHEINPNIKFLDLPE